MEIPTWNVRFLGRKLGFMPFTEIEATRFERFENDSKESNFRFFKVCKAIYSSVAAGNAKSVDRHRFLFRQQRHIAIHIKTQFKQTIYSPNFTVPQQLACSHRFCIISDCHQHCRRCSINFVGGTNSGWFSEFHGLNIAGYFLAMSFIVWSSYYGLATQNNLNSFTSPFFFILIRYAVRILISSLTAPRTLEVLT